MKFLTLWDRVDFQVGLIRLCPEDATAEKAQLSSLTSKLTHLLRNLYKSATFIIEKYKVAPVAQWIEHLTTDQEVTGSTPVGRAILESPSFN